LSRYGRSVGEPPRELLVPPGDEAALSAALNVLLNSENTRKGLAARTPEILGRLSIEKIGDMWEQLIRLATEQRKRSAQ